MKSNVPWSVKGIDPEARVVAKEAARKAGMTLGEWMNQAIREVGEHGEPGDKAGENAAEGAPAALSPNAGTGVTIEQLRAVVDSLNRINDRLRLTEDSVRQSEERSRRVAGDLGHGLETVFERIKRVEREKAQGSSEGLSERIERLERGEGNRGQIDGLKTLERALTSMVEALEVTRSESLDKIRENEEALSALAGRVDVLDSRLSAGFAEVHDAIDAVGQHLDRTERTAKAVMEEAQQAAGSTDTAFVEQTSKRLQILGNEIKRSGDQIRMVEEMVGRLSDKIEAAEHRSAEGIGEVAGSLETLRRAVLGAEASNEAAETGEAPLELEGLGGESLAQATREADLKVSQLQRSYEAMMARLEGRPLPADEPDGEAEPPFPDETPAPLQADSLDGDVASGDEEFDAVFGQLSDAPSGEKGSAQPLAAADPTLSAPLPPEDGPDDDLPASSGAKERLARLSPRQKVLLAAKARQKRIEAEREADAAPAAPAPASEAPASDPDIGAPVFEAPEAEEKPRLAERLLGGATSEGRRFGVVHIALLTVLVLAAAVAAWAMFGGEAKEAPRPAPAAAASAAPVIAPTPAPVQAEPSIDAGALYREAKVRQATATTAPEAAEAVRLFEEAAEAGSIPARFEIGEAYYKGTGVPENPLMAERHFSDAAMMGNVLAMHRLGSIEVFGTTGQQNVRAAVDWFDNAASYGVVDSMYNLGYLYDPSSPDNPMPAGDRDAARSYYWYALAAKQGDRDAAEAASLVAGSLTPEKLAELDADVAGFVPMTVNPAANDGLHLTD
ncbi:tetratricopeptide repeat protein [Parvularcula dongshanensis]|uniref:TPR repeat protein n=1 Tax=Parvularcula dongshanensis TaxID=1173995 RepID=A0A840I0I9_9PROT|nr:tetratricopeptide repeat protein [Parvularcula dongshanensis]MBB4658227.1 TPR repeat protein [Parvularcula dongshanensis]